MVGEESEPALRASGRQRGGLCTALPGRSKDFLANIPEIHYAKGDWYMAGAAPPFARLIYPAAHRGGAVFT